MKSDSFRTGYDDQFDQNVNQARLATDTEYSAGVEDAQDQQDLYEPIWLIVAA